MCQREAKANNAQWDKSALNTRIREKIKLVGSTFFVNFFYLTYISPLEKLYM